MTKNNLYDALKEVVAEKNLPMSVLIQAIEEALVIAYRKNFDSEEDVRVTLEEGTGAFRVIARRTVVETEDDMDEPDRQFTLEEARELKEDAAIGDVVEEDVTPPSFGRIAAQTARQVVSQKLKEAERSIIYKEFQDRVGQVLSGKVQRVERGQVYVEFIRAEAVMPPQQQIPGEVFRTAVAVMGAALDPKTHLYAVWAELPNPPGREPRLLPGMTGEDIHHMGVSQMG
ncbi:MAG TPA: NusA N-terminal domain-containing protein, partial [Candidatus Ozemobacteraceae bacterium]|nr:NusA N-terminal domain-containing protein [Candidatus Ozemobacteraceae bacterium]